jgi:hypothetical protein
MNFDEILNGRTFNIIVLASLCQEEITLFFFIVASALFFSVKTTAKGMMFRVLRLSYNMGNHNSGQIWSRFVQYIGTVHMAIAQDKPRVGKGSVALTIKRRMRLV